MYVYDIRTGTYNWIRFLNLVVVVSLVPRTLRVFARVILFDTL